HCITRPLRQSHRSLVGDSRDNSSWSRHEVQARVRGHSSGGMARCFTEQDCPLLLSARPRRRPENRYSGISFSSLKYASIHSRISSQLSESSQRKVRASAHFSAQSVVASDSTFIAPSASPASNKGSAISLPAVFNSVSSASGRKP